MKHEIVIRDISGIDEAAKIFIKETAGHNIIAFFAPMGAGKTTFTSAICRQIGVKDAVCSPTFTIINEYRAADGEIIYHFDFYRITRLQEAMDIGLEDYLYSGCLCLMEWPENIDGLLPEDTLKVHIVVDADNSRRISWEDRPPKNQKL